MERDGYFDERIATVYDDYESAHHFAKLDGRLERSPMPFRYVWPSELDLMAELAGMKSSERWDGWNREPFTSGSRKHVSVWEKLE